MSHPNDFGTQSRQPGEELHQGPLPDCLRSGEDGEKTAVKKPRNLLHRWRRSGSWDGR
jgi:hypothetical protein